MGISISPSAFHNVPYQTQTPKVHTFEELQHLKKEPTKVAAEGDVYHSSAIDFKKLSLDELRNEKFTVDTSKHTYTTHSDGSTDDMTQLVAIRDPKGSGEILTFDLSKKTIDNLKKKFGDSDNFFERNDGVLRLNGNVENFVAGWMQDIRQNRNYDKADADGNGRIEGDEAQALTIAFERQSDYDYIGEKLVQINLGMGATHQSLGNSSDAYHLFETEKEKAEDKAQGYTYKRNAVFSQYTKFENTVEKELDHTLQMDANLDGTVTLDESLSDEFGPNYTQQVIHDMQEFHKHLLTDRPDLNDETRLQNHNIGLYNIIKQTQYLKDIEEQIAQNRSNALDILDAKKLLDSRKGEIDYAAAAILTNKSKTDHATFRAYG